MRMSLSLAFAVLGVSTSVAAHADLVTITGGTYSANVDGTSATATLTPGDRAAGVVVNANNSVSSTIVTSSSTSIAFSFDQTLSALVFGGSTEGDAIVYFTALTDSLYTISDAKPGNFVFGLDEFYTVFQDLTTGTIPYQTGSGVSLTGVLTAGDTYYFASTELLQAQAISNVVFTPSISFSPRLATAIPEPSILVLLGIGVLGLMGATRRRFVKA